MTFYGKRHSYMTGSTPHNKGKNKFGIKLENFESYEEYSKACSRARDLGRKDCPKRIRQKRYSAVKRWYGITPKEYEKYEAINTCYLCGEHMDITKERKVLHHNHKTDKVYGMVHDSCNLIEGIAKGNPDKLRKISDQIKKDNS